MPTSSRVRCLHRRLAAAVGAGGAIRAAHRHPGAQHPGHDRVRRAAHHRTRSARRAWRGPPAAAAVHRRARRAVARRCSPPRAAAARRASTGASCRCAARTSARATPTRRNNAGVLRGRLAGDGRPGHAWTRRATVFVTGRAKDVIIRSSHNIDPGGDRRRAHGPPRCAAGAVVGEPDAYAGEVPVAYVSLRPGRTVGIEQLAEFAQARIPGAARVPESHLHPRRIACHRDRQALQAHAARHGDPLGGGRTHCAQHAGVEG
jgi:acyl-CoA synthetase (AMP-forming)/AMP-acid ligase II